MFSEWLERLRGLHVGKRVVTVALLLAVTFLAVRLIEGASFFDAFTQSCAIAFALMVVLMTARNLWRGDDVDEAEIAGQRIRFGRTRKALGVLDGRVSAQMTTVNNRLYDLEKEVFKDRGDG